MKKYKEIESPEEMTDEDVINEVRSLFTNANECRRILRAADAIAAEVNSQIEAGTVHADDDVPDALPYATTDYLEKEYDLFHTVVERAAEKRL